MNTFERQAGELCACVAGARLGLEAGRPAQAVSCLESAIGAAETLRAGVAAGNRTKVVVRPELLQALRRDFRRARMLQRRGLEFWAGWRDAMAPSGAAYMPDRQPAQQPGLPGFRLEG